MVSYIRIVIDEYIVQYDRWILGVLILMNKMGYFLVWSDFDLISDNSATGENSPEINFLKDIIPSAEVFKKFLFDIENYYIAHVLL